MSYDNLLFEFLSFFFEKYLFAFNPLSFEYIGDLYTTHIDCFASDGLGP